MIYLQVSDINMKENARKIDEISECKDMAALKHFLRNPKIFGE